jgi:spore germination cell wall hydrolase CwlJ-like protein
MVASRSGPKGAGFGIAPFGLAALASVVVPTSMGYGDLASLIAQQPAVSERWREHMIASPFGTIHAATFNFPRPVGTSIPEPENFRLASFDPDGPELSGAASGRSDDGIAAPIVFPTVDRTKKGDFLGSRIGPSPQPDAPAEPDVATSPAPPAEPDPVADGASDEFPVIDFAKEIAAPSPPRAVVDEIEAAVRFQPLPEYDISLSLELNPQIPVEPVDPAHPEGGQPDISLIALANDPDPTERMSRLFFGGSPMNTFSAAIEPWAAGEEPVLMMPRAPGDPAIRPAALTPNPDGELARDGGGGGGTTVANKGEVTAEDGHTKSPAEWLKLSGKPRDKAEKCLANAVYFEARNEPVRGQIGVAQVVLNRVFSGFYPHDVCNVVYQNAHRHLACQFTFACDGIPDIVTDAESWARAKRIARASLDGKVWLPEIGKATHYHANYVHPWWVRSMHKLHRIGAHIFYRPREWGDGSEAPAWGTPTATAATAPQL